MSNQSNTAGKVTMKDLAGVRVTRVELGRGHGTTQVKTPVGMQPEKIAAQPPLWHNKSYDMSLRQQTVNAQDAQSKAFLKRFNIQDTPPLGTSRKGRAKTPVLNT